MILNGKCVQFVKFINYLTKRPCSLKKCLKGKELSLQMNSQVILCCQQPECHGLLGPLSCEECKAPTSAQSPTPNSEGTTSKDEYIYKKQGETMCALSLN